MRHHLAILYRTYLDQIAAGRKTVECRLGKMGCPPHRFVRANDLIWFKEVSGPVRLVARAESVRTFSGLTIRTVERIRQEWNDAVQAPAVFWDDNRSATVATLIWLGGVCPLRPFRVHKRDRRSWVVLAGPPIPDRPILTHRAVVAELSERARP